MGLGIDKTSIDFRIASAFLRQRYPLSSAGMELKEKVRYEIEHGSLSSELIEQLPTVENLRLELFADFDLTPEQELKIFGWDLSCIQTHKGCTHQCEICYKDAGRKLEMMPFAAIAKIAKKKLKYDKMGVNEWLVWQKRLLDKGILDIYKFWPPKFFRGRRDEIMSLVKILLAEWEDYSPKVLMMRPFLESMPLRELKINYLHSVPVNYGSVHYSLFTYDDNDPLDYRDSTFLHTDGTLADYGDVFHLMATSLRPISITTAGWFSEDNVACRAMKKIVDECKESPEYGDLRISVHRYERHIKADVDKYLDEIVRMIRESASLETIVNLYYDRGNKQEIRVINMLTGFFEKILIEELGVKNTDKRIITSPVSFEYGRAQQLQEGDDYDAWDPDQNLCGIHIRPDGLVDTKPDYDWTIRKNKEGKSVYELHVPEGSVAEPTGDRLFQLEN